MVIIRKLEIPLTGIRYQDANVDALLGDEVLGKGSLYITEEQIMWMKETGGEGFTIQYKKMTLHAISRDPNVHPRDCIYVMINGNLDTNDENGPPSPNDDEEETTELRFIPDDPGRLDELYKAIQDCTLLHPDASSDMSESSEEEAGAAGTDEIVREYQGFDGPFPVIRGPMYGMGGGRLIPGQIEEESEMIELHNHFGARLIFENRNFGMVGIPNSNGNGTSGLTPQQLREMYEDDEDEGANNQE